MSDAPETIWIDDERSIGGSANILYDKPPYDDPYIYEYRLTSLPATDAQAMANPKVQALVEAACWYSDDPSSQGDIARAALAALEAET